MTITVNGRSLEFEGSVADLLESQRGERRPHGLAVAIGDDVVPRDDWERWRLREGDEVEIVMAVQGG